MYDHRPPVTWPSCSWTRTCSSAVQPWPPNSTGSEPPWRRASIAARRIGSPQSRGTRPPAARTRPRAAGGRRGRTRGRAPGARAGPGVRVRSIAGKDAPRSRARAGAVACPGTGRRKPGQATRSSRIVDLRVWRASACGGRSSRTSCAPAWIGTRKVDRVRHRGRRVRPRIQRCIFSDSRRPASRLACRRSRRVAAVCSKTGPSFALADATRTSTSPTLARTPSTSPRPMASIRRAASSARRTATVEEVDQDVAVDRRPGDDARTSASIDEGLSLKSTLLPLVSQPADIGRRDPGRTSPCRRQGRAIGPTAVPVACAGRSTSPDTRTSSRSPASMPEFAARLARHDDLVLGANLDA